MGRRIRLRRLELGYGLNEFARKIDMVPSWLSRIETEDREISTETLRKLAYHLGVSADWLLGSYEPCTSTQDKGQD